MVLSLLVKHIFIVFSSVYTYITILNTEFSKKILFCGSLLGVITLHLISYFLPPYNTFINIVIIIILIVLFINIFKPINLDIAVLALLLSSTLSITFYTLSVIFVSIIFVCIYRASASIPYSLTDLLTSLLHLVFLITTMNNKQFKSGIMNLIKSNRRLSSILLCLILIICFILSAIFSSSNFLLRFSIITFFIVFSLFLLFYWRHRIKQTYIKNLRRLETLTYENTIIEKDKQIKALEENNAYLARMIHKYRKTIPALELSVLELYQSDEFYDMTVLRSKAESLQAQLNELRQEQNTMLDCYRKETVVTPLSGLPTIDALLALMEKRATQTGIRFNIKISPDISRLISQSLTESDLLHLLGDLIENAINAVNSVENKEIVVHLGTLNDCLLLEVSDSGIAFDVQTYQHFGNEPFSSHKEDGGSGTGLMDIWKLKKEYKISLYIYEYEPKSHICTKKISFLFDRKNHFLLKTYRDKEVKSTLIRGDLHVFPHKSD